MIYVLLYLSRLRHARSHLGGPPRYNNIWRPTHSKTSVFRFITASVTMCVRFRRYYVLLLLFFSYFYLGTFFVFFFVGGKSFDIGSTRGRIRMFGVTAVAEKNDSVAAAIPHYNNILL